MTKIYLDSSYEIKENGSIDKVMPFRFGSVIGIESEYTDKMDELLEQFKKARSENSRQEIDKRYQKLAAVENDRLGRMVYKKSLFHK